MKKVFLGSIYILFITMLFIYMLVDASFLGYAERSQNLVSLFAFTGISIIGFVFIFPAFVFTIISLSTGRRILGFWRDLFTLFASFFCLITAVLAFINIKNYASLYIPIILAVSAIILLVFTIVGIRTALKEEKEEEKAKEKEKAETVEVIEQE